MINNTKLGTYYDIYSCIRENPRITITYIAKKIGHTGIGRRRATVSTYVHNMYDSQISLKPNLYFKNLENLLWKAYLCRAKKGYNVGKIFDQLKKDDKITYVVLISGHSDFFITSRNPFFDVTQYDMEIVEETQLFSPIFTRPQGWNLSLEKAARSMINAEFKPGRLSRKTQGVYEMAELDEKIFEIMKKDVRIPFSHVGKETGVFSMTVKDHFNKKILSLCNVAHYFFPCGYNNYMKSYFRIHTKYEKSLVTALEFLPCTSYVYPFDNGLLISIFHENIKVLMQIFKKLESMGVVEHYTPLWHEHF